MFATDGFHTASKILQVEVVNNDKDAVPMFSSGILFVKSVVLGEGNF